MVQKVGAAVCLRAHRGQGDALAAALATLGETLARRAGTELWLVLRTPDEPDTLWLWEIFASEQAREAHRAHPDYLAGLAHIEKLSAQPPTFQPVIPFAGKGLVAPPGEGRQPP